MEQDKLLVALKSDVREDRLYAVEDIISLNKSELVPSLLEHLAQEEDRMVRELIVEGLKVLDISGHYEHIAGFFESSDAFLRNCTIEIFGSEGEDAVAFLTSVMDHENKEVRKLVLDSLVATNSKYSIPALKAALKDPAPNVKITAIEYLGQLEDKDSLGEVLELLKNTDEPMLRISCIETLIVLGTEDTVDEVIDALGGENMDSFFKPTVFRLIAEHGCSRHVEFVRKFLNSRNQLFVFETAHALVRIFSKYGCSGLDDKDLNYIAQLIKNTDLEAETRITLMNAISFCDYGDKEALFTGVSHDEDINLVMNAIELLSRVNKDRALKLLDSRLKGADTELEESLNNLKAMIAE